jgi:MFS family permease
VGSFQQYYEVGPLKDYSSSTIAWIPSLQIFFLFALGPVVGIIFDNYGPRPLIIGGTLLHVFGLMMASLAKTYYQFILSQGVCSAIGVACLYSPGKFNLLPPPLRCSMLTESCATQRLPASQPGFPRSAERLWASW